MPEPCCSPDRGSEGPMSPLPEAKPSRSARGAHIAAVSIPAGRFLMGNGRNDGYPGDGEGHVHDVSLPEFDLATTTVTNVQFSDFVTDSGYLTDAERFGWSFVFAGLLPDRFPATAGAAQAPWWRQVFGASWR